MHIFAIIKVHTTLSLCGSICNFYLSVSIHFLHSSSYLENYSLSIQIVFWYNYSNLSISCGDISQSLEVANSKESLFKFQQCEVHKLIYTLSTPRQCKEGERDRLGRGEREGKDRGNRVAKRGEDGIDEEGGQENISNADQSGSYSN